MKKILIILGIIILFLLSGCNFHSIDWDKEQCNKMGMKHYSSGVSNLIKCEDKKTHEIKIYDVHYLENLDNCECDYKKKYHTTEEIKVQKK